MDWTEMRRLGTMKPDGTFEIEMSLPTTESGKVRRCCPNPDCRPGLALLGDGPDIAPPRAPGMRRRPQAGGMTCPYCGTDADDDDWLCEEDLDHVVDRIEWAAERDMAQEVQHMVEGFNRKARGNPLGISMEVKSPRRSRPRAWIEDLLRELACDRCGREYGVFAIGLFCPDCGSANLAVHFHREIELIERQLEIAEEITEGETSWRLLGNAHEDVLTALETYLKVGYRFIVTERHEGDEREQLLKKAAGNAFQSPERASQRYEDLDIDLLGHLDEDEQQLLDVYVHTRHVIGHNLGLVDERFTQNTDRGSEGETVPLVAEDVHRFAVVAGRVIAHLEQSAPELAQA